MPPASSRPRTSDADLIVAARRSGSRTIVTARDGGCPTVPSACGSTRVGDRPPMTIARSSLCCPTERVRRSPSRIAMKASSSRRTTGSPGAAPASSSARRSLWYGSHACTIGVPGRTPRTSNASSISTRAPVSMISRKLATRPRASAGFATRPASPYHWSAAGFAPTVGVHSMCTPPSSQRKTAFCSQSAASSRISSFGALTTAKLSSRHDP